MGRRSISLSRRTTTTTSQTPNYKPVSLRWPFLSLFVLYLCGLIAVLEFASRTFPHAADREIPQDPSQDAPILVSAPLINVRTPIPTPTPTPPPTPPSPLKLRKVYRTFRYKRSTNATTTDDEIVMTHEGVEFNGRHGFPPPLVASQNETTVANGTYARRGWKLRPRVQDKDFYAKFSGPRNKVHFMIGGPDLDTNTGSGQLIYFAEDETSADCVATCDGPALIYHEQRCFDHWVEMSIEEVQWQNRYPNANWIKREQEYGGHRCADPNGARVVPQVSVLRDDLGNAIETQTHFSISQFIPVTTAVLRDDKGAATKTITGGLGQVTEQIITVHDPVRGVDIVSTLPPGVIAVTQRDANGVPTRTAISDLRPGLTTLTLRDTRGVATATVIVNTASTQRAVTLRDEKGAPTATIITRLAPGESSLTLTDSSGRPTATVPVDSIRPNRAPPKDSSITHHIVTQPEYWAATFLPVLLTTLISILAQVVSSDIRAMVPFHALTQPGGVTASYSLLLPTGVINDYLTSYRLLVHLREPLPILADFLVLLASVITALSTESVGIKLYGSCAESSFLGCFMGLAVFTAPSIAMKALLCTALVVLVIVCVLLSRWETGVAAPPHSIAAAASLAQSPSLRKLFVKMEVDEGTDGYVRQRWLSSQLEGRLFSFSRFRSPHRKQDEYGVTTVETNEMPIKRIKPQGSFKSIVQTRTASFKSTLRRTATACRRSSPAWLVDQPTTDYAMLLGLLLHIGLMVLLLYYEKTGGDTAFEAFMMDQNFGARFFFTVVGIVVAFFWGYYSSGKSAPDILSLDGVTHNKNSHIRVGTIPVASAGPADRGSVRHGGPGSNVFQRSGASTSETRVVRGADPSCRCPFQPDASAAVGCALQPHTNMGDAPHLRVDVDWVSRLHGACALVRCDIGALSAHAVGSQQPSGKDILRV